MNFGRTEGYVERNLYLFKNFSFRFKGLKEDTRVRFEIIVKKLGAKVCEDAKYTLVEKQYENLFDGENYYSLKYILDSIEASEALDIDKYRLGRIVTNQIRNKSISSEVQIIESDDKMILEPIIEFSQSSENSIGNFSENSVGNFSENSWRFESDATLDDSEKWWLNLPEPDLIKIEKCPETKSRSRRGSDYSLEEKRTMIAYLVVNDKIRHVKSRAPFLEMHWNGYMKHRSVESMHNNFRRTILPNISKFNLPADIEKKFKFSGSKF
ncbi:uncharacterized protein LOC106657710 [Trichogramma pretiosum]|uniref:uncharacterized protein LOC106657710 n=1 Tax=Trichogramma pretiosum TaxID=7493 RepID=UPI0006C9BFF3|nr:uncharacterized protein LOC106657710 [Trichogramma pretiosum]XP_014234858.1 uncharacterized protein LOC106657710 [Trichogramma pretiosum]